MTLFIGVDTSNYASSLGVFSPGGGALYHDKRMLPVRPGELGLRQSDALFEHVRALPDMLRKLGSAADMRDVAAVGVSVRPRDIEGSYMPCFLAGREAAYALAAALGAPVCECSHQAGHLVSALYATELYERGAREFMAFHVSGGTTDAAIFRFEGPSCKTEQLASSLDAHAGQVIDRVGASLGMAFPAGGELSELAVKSGCRDYLRPSLKGADCCLSGLENRCASLAASGAQACDVARYCLNSVAYALLSMTRALEGARRGLPIIYAGGVMQSSVIRDILAENVSGAYFADPPWLSADNAIGPALLAYEAMR